MARNPEARMTLGEHLVEFRRRLIVSVMAIAAGSIGGYLLADIIWAALAAPLTNVANLSGRLAEINYTSISEAFDTRLAIALTVGIVVSSPVWLWQLWAFITPALVRRERRLVVGFVGSAVPLFVAGCAAGWWVFPHVVELMASFAPEGSTTLLTARYYLDFSIKFILAIGVGFVLPVFLVLLNFAGILSGKSILSGWRWAVIGITTFTALATPAADLVSMFLLAIPMLVLYVVAALITLVRDRRIARAAVA